MSKEKLEPMAIAIIVVTAICVLSLVLAVILGSIKKYLDLASILFLICICSMPVVSLLASIVLLKGRRK